MKDLIIQKLRARISGEVFLSDRTSIYEKLDQLDAYAEQHGEERLVQIILEEQFNIDLFPVEVAIEQIRSTVKGIVRDAKVNRLKVSQ